MSLNRLFVIGAIVVVIVGLGLGFKFLGTPAHQRVVLMDERRTADLQRITNVLHGRYPSGGLPKRLPASILDRDPVTSRGYEFRRVNATHYVLCAVFDTDQGPENGQEYSEHATVFPPATWRHGAGRTCYELDVTENPPVVLRRL